MKIPAVAIAAAFAGGILLGQDRWSNGPFTSPRSVFIANLYCAGALLLSLFFTRRNQLVRGAVTSLFA